MKCNFCTTSVRWNEVSRKDRNDNNKIIKKKLLYEVFTGIRHDPSRCDMMQRALFIKHDW